MSSSLSAGLPPFADMAILASLVLAQSMAEIMASPPVPIYAEFHVARCGYPESSTSILMRTSCTSVLTPSFFSTCERCTSTVRSLIPRS